jgi:hypothetical protein
MNISHVRQPTSLHPAEVKRLLAGEPYRSRRMGWSPRQFRVRRPLGRLPVPEPARPRYPGCYLDVMLAMLAHAFPAAQAPGTGAAKAVGHGRLSVF